MHRELCSLARPNSVGFRPLRQDSRITTIRRSQKRRPGERSPRFCPDFAFSLHSSVQHGRSKSCVFVFPSSLSALDGHCLRGNRLLSLSPALCQPLECHLLDGYDMCFPASSFPADVAKSRLFLAGEGVVTPTHRRCSTWQLCPTCSHQGGRPLHASSLMNRRKRK